MLIFVPQKNNFMRRLNYLLLIAFTFTSYSQNPNSDSVFINKIYNEALSNGESYEWLDYLSNQIGGRLSGSVNYDRSVKWGKEQLELIDIDSVWLQPVMVPKWVRGAPEYAHIETRPGNNISVPIAALGGSISTPLIVSNVNGLKEIIQRDKSGEVFNNTAKDLSKAILNSIKRDRQELYISNIRKSKVKYTWSRFIKELEII